MMIKKRPKSLKLIKITKDFFYNSVSEKKKNSIGNIHFRRKKNWRLNTWTIYDETFI